MRHLDLVEEKETVVHGAVICQSSSLPGLNAIGNLLVSELGTNVTNVNVLQRQVSLHVTDLDNERMRAVWLAANDELSHNDCMVGGTTERANPPLGSCEGRGVDDEGLVLGVPGRSGLETTHVGTVTQLSLSVTPNVLVVLRLLQESFVLFWATLVAESNLK